MGSPSDLGCSATLNKSCCHLHNKTYTPQHNQAQLNLHTKKKNERKRTESCSVSRAGIYEKAHKLTAHEHFRMNYGDEDLGEGKGGKVRLPQIDRDVAFFISLVL